MWVTGAGGFIGRRFLEKAPHEAFSLTHHSRTRLGAEALSEQTDHDHYSHGDLLDWESIRWSSTEAHVDVAVHLASPSTWSILDSPEVYDHIIQSAQNALHLALGKGLRHFVYVSSASALGGYHTHRDFLAKEKHFLPQRKAYPYAAAKRDVEKLLQELCREAGVDFSVVYPTEVYGPGDEQMVTAGSVQEMLSGPCALVSQGGTYIVHLDDVVDALWARVRSERQGRDLLAGEFVTFKEMAVIVRKLARKSPRVVEIPDRVIAMALWIRRYCGVDLVGFPDAAAKYGQVYWECADKTGFTEAWSHFRGAREILASVVDWLDAKRALPKTKKGTKLE